jgi:hypothetical protein
MHSLQLVVLGAKVLVSEVHEQRILLPFTSEGLSVGLIALSLNSCSKCLYAFVALVNFCATGAFLLLRESPCQLQEWNHHDALSEDILLGNCFWFDFALLEAADCEHINLPKELPIC